MFKILDARLLASDIKLFRIRATRIARKQHAGQFVVVRVHDHGERIPLTIADSDPIAGTITLVVQGVGKTTRLMNALQAGDALRDVVGPLGKPSELGPFGTVVMVGGGVGAAIAYPIAKALTAQGNHVVSILGARTRELVILEPAIRAVSEQTHILTDDGTYGERGLVTTKLEALMACGRPIDRVVAIGPVPMMRAVADITRRRAIKTVVSLNAVMVDGTGMCGGCRVAVAGRSQFACVDGPEFDAHEVDFDVLAQRNAMYRGAERRALDAFLACPERDLAEVRQACKLTEATVEASDHEAPRS